MHFFNLHTHNYTNAPGILELVNQYPLEFDVAIPVYSIGIHPWKIVAEKTAKELAIIESKLPLENCLAIGECGLDKRIEVPFDLQQTVFEKQLLLAEKYNKPVIIHCVAAFQELIEIKNKLRISVPIIIHGFSKNEQLAKQLLDNGFYISFGKYLLRNSELESVFKSIPNDRFFLETDTIEEGIREIYQLAAKYRQTDLETLQQTINDNFRKVFKHT
jgi:TatD DNase family protein